MQKNSQARGLFYSSGTDRIEDRSIIINPLNV